MSEVLHPGLKKQRLSTATVVFMIFCLAAAGAYGIEDMISGAGPGLTLLMLILLPFVWSMPMGLISTELGSAIPEEGGFYKWIQRGLGEFWAFQAGWWRVVSGYVDNTIYVVLAAAYLGTVIDMTPMEEYVFKAAMIVFFTWINLRGIKDVGLVSSAISLLVMVAFALVAIVGFANWQSNPFEPFAVPDQSLTVSIGAAIAIGMWMYSGYESMSTMAGELKDPQVIPRATLIAIPLIMASYILPTMGGLASIGSWEQWGAEGGISYGDVVAAYIPALAVPFVLVAVLANMSVFNAYITSGSRGFFAMAEDNLAPKSLVKCSKDHGVPYIAVLSLGVFALIAVMLPFEVIVVIDVMLFMSCYVVIFVAACVLRVKEPDMERPFRVPLGNKGFIAMCIPPVLIAVTALYLSGADYFLAGMVALSSGPIAYFFIKRKYGGMAKIFPGEFPLNPTTGMGLGDTRRAALLLSIMALACLAAVFFLPGNEDPQAYVDSYGIEGMFDKLMIGIRWLTGIFGVAAIALWVIARRVEPVSPNTAQEPRP